MNKNISTTYKTENGGLASNTIGQITVNELHDYVTKMASKIAKLSIDNSVVLTGTIINTLGGYKVQLKTNNSEVDARPLTEGAVYQAGDYIYLIRGAAAIDGGTSPSYFIFGRVDDTNEAFANASDLERFTSAGVAKQNVALGRTTYNKNSGVFWDALRNYKSLKIEGKFTTATDVGVTVAYNYQDGTTEEFKLDSAWMQGQPNNMQELPQSRVIERTKELAEDDSVIVTVAGGTNVTLTAGTLNKYLKDFSLEVKPANKSYFRNELPEKTGEDTVRLEAKLKYLDGAINSGVQYYWFVEMPEGITEESLVTEDKAQVNGIGGDRWYCLNSYSDCDVIGQTQKIRIWNKSDNFTLLDKFKYLLEGSNPKVFYFDKSEKIPFKFVNKIKCVAIYEGFYINSEIFELVDYSKENFTIDISANQPDLSLITESSEIILTCEVKQDNEMIENDKFSYSYLWFIDGKSEFTVKKVTTDSSPKAEKTYYTYNAQLKQFAAEVNLVTFKEGVTYYIEETVQYTQPTLKLKDTISNIYANNVYDLTGEQITVKCKVSIDGSDADTMSDYSEVSNELTVTSFVFSESTISEYIFYKYLIGGVNETFKSALGEDGYLTWSPTNTSLSWASDTNLADWTGETSNWPLTGKTGAAARKYLYEVALTIDSMNPQAKCLYYTTKSVWIKEELDPQLTGTQRYTKIKEEDQSLPRMLRGVTKNGNNLSEGAINKINVFNDLTNGGKEQGFYLEDVYYPTEDETPVSGKTYYLLSGGKYVEQEELGDEFEEGKTYYEYIENKLFINAEFIQTGALKIADENGNSIFYADIDNKYVEIGGFTVDANSISNNKAEESQIYIGQDSVKFGNNFTYTVSDGNLDVKGVEADRILVKDGNSTIFYASNDNSNIPNDVLPGIKVQAGGWQVTSDAFRDQNQTVALYSKPKSNLQKEELVCDYSSIEAFSLMQQIDNASGDEYYYFTGQTKSPSISINLKDLGSLNSIGDIFIQTEGQDTKVQITQTEQLLLTIEEVYFALGDKELKSVIDVPGTVQLRGALKLNEKTKEGEEDSWIEFYYNFLFELSVDHLQGLWADLDASFIEVRFDEVQDYQGENILFDIQRDCLSVGADSKNPALYRVAFDGSFIAQKGEIAGWKIDKDKLIKESYTKLDSEAIVPGVGLAATASQQDPAFYAGFIGGTYASPWDQPNGTSWEDYTSFFVKPDGSMKATKGDIANWSFSSEGFKCYNKNTDNVVYSFTEEGLKLNSGGEIAFGGSKLKTLGTEDQLRAVWRPLRIGSPENGSFVFNNKTIYIDGIHQGTLEIKVDRLTTDMQSSIQTWWKVTANLEMEWDKDYTIPEKFYGRIGFARGRIFGDHDYNDTTSGYAFDTSFNFALDPDPEIKSYSTSWFETSSKEWDLFNVYMRIGHSFTQSVTEDELKEMEGTFNFATGYKEENILAGGLSVSGYPVIQSTGWIVPQRQGLSLGNTDAPWEAIYAIDGGFKVGTWETAYAASESGTSSDLNRKHEIAPLSTQYGQLFDALQPVTYKYNDGTSDRTHTGFIAQDVLAAMQASGLSTQDFAGYIERTQDDGEITRYLRYGEFIALCVDQIQKLKSQVNLLEEKLNQLEKDKT